ncbi:MAG: glutamine synthetase, partial [Chloroflexi bacterium]|nr:glutamine synthetase [Chloroflexota bacterium]
GINTLPGSLWEAIMLAEKSNIVRKALGEHAFNAFIENKKIEWKRYQVQVSEYELKSYLPVW